ncbi:MAG: SH3 domain-containing protein [Bacteroidota bacterium]|nr:MAG: SH3 domain-containing protein [Bacteroidota bacterium]
MKIPQLIIILQFLIVGIPLNAQDFGYINDPDGYTNLRLEPNGKSEIIGIVIAGQVFKYYPDNNIDWWKVDFKFRTGFMHKSKIKDFNKAKSEISKYFQDYYSADRNNVELSEGNNEKLFKVTLDYPLATMQAFCEQSKEIQDYLISEYKSPIHDMIDLQLIYSRLEGEKTECSEISKIKDAIIRAGKSIGLEIIENDIDFNKIPNENKPCEKLWGVNNNFTEILNGKPITFYLNNPQIDRFSKMYYQGQFKLYDNSETFAFLDSVMTLNNEIRPFYFYIFNSVLNQSDGALSEYVSVFCLKYFETQPCEFFNYCKNGEYKVDKSKWTGFIGFQLYSKTDFDKFVITTDRKINGNCQVLKSDWNILKNEIKTKLEE